MPENNNPFNLSPDTLQQLQQLADKQHQLTQLYNGLFDTAINKPSQQSNQRLIDFPHPGMALEKELCSKVETLCSNEQLHKGLLNNLGLTYSVLPMFDDKMHRAIRVDVRGIHPYSAEVWQEVLMLDTDMLVTTYAADVVLRVQIANLFERMVKRLGAEKAKAEALQGR